MAEKTIILPKKLAGKATAGSPISRYDKDARIPSDTVNLYNQDLGAIRQQPNPTTAVRTLARKEGTAGTAVFSFTEIANSGYTVSAYDTNTHEFSPEGTQLTRTVLSQIDTLYDYTKGYSDKRTIDSLISVMLREVTISSFVGLELVLNKEQFPDKLVPVPFEGIAWMADGNGGRYPLQPGTFTGTDDIPLNIPTFWTATLHEDLTLIYATPMLEPAIDRSFQFLDFIQDMWRVTKQSGHSRLSIVLDAEKIRAAAPPKIRQDSAKLQQFMEEQRQAVEEVVSSLQPEDALVSYDSVDTDVLQAKDVKADYTQLLTTLSGMLATSLKSHPSILGLRIGGSQSLSNTESLVYLKNAKAIQQPIVDVMSRALTLAVRLYGADVYVKFKFNPINLRPDDELEAYTNMRQKRIVELWSLGCITDEEANQMLGAGKRPPGAPPLSGTMFYGGSGAARINDPQAPRDPQGEVLQPDTPGDPGGEN